MAKSENKMNTIISELQNASKMHLRQSKELKSHVKDMQVAKKSPLDISCWPGFKKVGTQESPSGKKTAGGNPKIVNDCKKI